MKVAKDQGHDNAAAYANWKRSMYLHIAATVDGRFKSVNPKYNQ